MIGRETIERLQQPNALDLLRTVPGVEATLFVAPLDPLSIQFNYPYTEDKDSNKQLLRRARNRLAVDLLYQVRADLDLTVSYLHIGQCEDVFFDMSDCSSERPDMSSYSIVNVAVGYDLNPTVHLYGRVDNLFDKDYNETWGYESPGVSVYAGIKLHI